MYMAGRPNLESVPQRYWRFSRADRILRSASATTSWNLGRVRDRIGKYLKAQNPHRQSSLQREESKANGSASVLLPVSDSRHDGVPPFVQNRTRATCSQFMPLSSKTKAFTRRANRCVTELLRANAMSAFCDLQSLSPPREARGARGSIMPAPGCIPSFRCRVGNFRPCLPT
jgi:hypothetical protein